MEKLLQKLTQFFKQPTALELYVNSKCPTNAAEIEFWVRQYQQQSLERFL